MIDSRFQVSSSGYSESFMITMAMVRVLIKNELILILVGSRSVASQ